MSRASVGQPSATGSAMPLDAFSQAFASTDWDKVAAAARPVPAAAARPASGLAAGDAAAKPAAKPKANDDDGFLTFDDVLDIINPLQHIPIVDAIYRRLTGDTIRPQAEVLGGFLFGGLIGGAIATGGLLFTEATGVDPVPDMIAWLAGDETPGKPGDGPTTTAVAQAPAASDSPSRTASAQPAPPPPVTAIRSAVTPLQTASGRPMPVAASAETVARRNLTAANRNALQLLAQDLAAGGQLGGGDAGAAPAAPPPAQPLPQPAPGPRPVQTADAAAPGQPHPSRMPVRGGPTNPQMPQGLSAAGRRYGGYARTSNTPVAATPSPALTVPVGAAIASRTQQPAPAIKPLDAAQEIKPLDAAVAASPQLQPSLPLDPQVLGPDGVQQLMMRNLEKYQAMSRRPPRTASATTTSG